MMSEGSFFPIDDHTPWFVVNSDAMVSACMCVCVFFWTRVAPSHSFKKIVLSCKKKKIFSWNQAIADLLLDEGDTLMGTNATDLFQPQPNKKVICMREKKRSSVLAFFICFSIERGCMRMYVKERERVNLKKSFFF